MLALCGSLTQCLSVVPTKCCTHSRRPVSIELMPIVKVPTFCQMAKRRGLLLGLSSGCPLSFQDSCTISALHKECSAPALHSVSLWHSASNHIILCCLLNRISRCQGLGLSLGSCHPQCLAQDFTHDVTERQ